MKKKVFASTVLILPVLVLTFLTYVSAAPSELSGADSTALRKLETDILVLRHRELDNESRIERLNIDIPAIEKKWQNARESDTENSLLIDSTSPIPLKTKVLWEQLSAYRTDLENTMLKLDCYRKQRSILRMLRSTYDSPADIMDLWQSLIDTVATFKASLEAERQWRTERLADSRFETAALARVLAETTLTVADRQLLRKRKSYLENKISSDSLVGICIAGLDSSLTGYDAIAREAFKRITVKQQTHRLYRRLRNIWDFALYTVDNKPLTIGKIILALILIIVGLKIAQYISKLVTSIIKRRTRLDRGVIDAGEKLFFYCFAALFTLYALHIMQVPLTAFTVMGGALALGLGFGSQNILKNFISGIILLLERPMKTGDFLEVDGAIGTVESIGLRSTRIRTFDNIHMILPNSSFLEKNVINWTLADRLIRSMLQIGIQYGSPVHKAAKLLLIAAEKVPSVLRNPKPEVFFSDFGDNALVFDLYIWVNLTNIIDRRRVLSDLRFAINELFNEAGIVIAFPQRDIHIDAPDPLRIRLEPAGDLPPPEKTVP